MKFDLIIPEVLGYYPNFISKEECNLLRYLIDQRRRDPNRTEHLGSVTYPWSDMSLEGKNKVQNIRDRVLNSARGLTGKGIYINYSDLVYRDEGMDMEFHNDCDWYPERNISGILALNTRYWDNDGSSVLKYGDQENSFPHEAGRLLLFPSELQHKVLAPKGPRYCYLFWMTEFISHREGAV